MDCCRHTFAPRFSAFSLASASRASRSSVPPPPAPLGLGLGLGLVLVLVVIRLTIVLASTIAVVQRRTSSLCARSASMFARSISLSCAAQPATNPPPRPSASRRSSSARPLPSARRSAAARRALSAPLSAATTVGELRTTAMRSPKRSEQSVSSACSASHATLITTDVHERPPKESRSSMVRAASRYGTCTGSRRGAAPPPRGRRAPPRALITRPRALSEPLMLAASALAAPSTPVFLVRSEPARSTNSSVVFVRRPPPPPPAAAPAPAPAAACRTRCSLTRQWLRDERSFKAWLFAVRVASTVLANFATSAALMSLTSVSPTVAKASPVHDASGCGGVAPAAALEPVDRADLAAPPPPPPPLRAAAILAWRAAFAASLAFSIPAKHRRHVQLAGCTPFSATRSASLLPFSALPPAIRWPFGLVVPTASWQRSFSRSKTSSW
jgi:hypothetical protein